jgi:repressor LexA
MCQATLRNTVAAPAMNGGDRKAGDASGFARPAERVDQLRCRSVHGQEHAIIARKSQAKSCVRRICDNRILSHDARVDRAEIRARLKEKGIKQVDLANMLGIDPDKVSKSLSAGGTRTFTPDEMLIIRQALRQDGDPLAPTDYWTVPIIGQVQAGFWSEAIAKPIGSMPTPNPSMNRRAFGLEVVGTSMDKLVEEGGVVLVDPDDKALFPKRYYVVLNEQGETTFKQFFADPARLEPCSNDPQHKTLVLGDGQTYKIVGRVIWRAAQM